MEIVMEQAPVAQWLSAVGVIPVVALPSVDAGLRLAEVLATEGLPAIEITFRTASAAEAIAAVRREFPDLLVAAGTVLSTTDVRRAVDAGAQLGVAPGLQPSVLDAAAEAGLPFAPGIATASEASIALERGITLVKLFPAEVVGGVALIDALGGPLPRLSYMPTGGIREDNLADYLARPTVAACGGTWIAPTALLESGDYAEIARRTRAAVQAVHRIRPHQTGASR